MGNGAGFLPRAVVNLLRLLEAISGMSRLVDHPRLLAEFVVVSRRIPGQSIKP
jgi:hypothetical protein